MADLNAQADSSLAASPDLSAKTVDLDYSVYLVTGRDLLPPGKSYLESLEESIKGGVTIVQVREKHADTGEFIKIAAQTKVICDKYNIPLIINDRVDVALAVGATGVHLGQADMDIAVARKLLPEGSVIGISCNTPEHVAAAVKAKADYVGIGAVWGTQTKNLTSPIIGVRGVGERLQELDGTKVRSVAIGGINAGNLWRTLHGSVSVTGHGLDGVAVVSGIVASEDPQEAAAALSRIVKAFKNAERTWLEAKGVVSKSTIIDGVADVVSKIRNLNPLVHQITNHVVATQSANVTLAIGASPIMATEPKEMEDLSKICGAVLVNIGTLREDGLEGSRLAGKYANKFRKPVVFDPVGVGATTFRKQGVKELLNLWQAGVIKGNAGELAALAGTDEVLSKGVDSVGCGFKDPAAFVRNLAKRERCVIVLTGPIDYISNGTTTVSLANGNPMLDKITGSGCILGSCIASFCATLLHGKTDACEPSRLVDLEKLLIGAIAGTLVLTVASELAAERQPMKGPGTFLPALVDALWMVTPQDIRDHAKIRIFD